MTRLTAKDFPQQLLEYYDYYAHGKISKREFLQLAGKYTVGGMTALALFNLLKPDYALAEQVPFTDPDIRPEYIHYPSPDGHGKVRAYLVTPTKIADKAPAVVVVHENRGLNPYIEDVARRVAKAGYIALAPDGLSAVGGYPGNDDEGRALQQKVDPVKLMNDFCGGRVYGEASTGDGEGRYHRVLLRRRRQQRGGGGDPGASLRGAVLRPPAAAEGGR